MLGERFNIPAITLRYFNAYGPRSFSPNNPFSAYTSVIGIFHHRKRAGQPLLVTGDGEQSRDFVYVRDIARANLAAALSDWRGEVYNVGGGTQITVNAVAKLFHHPVEHIDERKGEARAACADITKITRELGWRPEVTLEQGIQRLAEAEPGVLAGRGKG
jgi:UDP-glucose 4-epimerase